MKNVVVIVENGRVEQIITDGTVNVEVLDADCQNTDLLIDVENIYGPQAYEVVDDLIEVNDDSMLERIVKQIKDFRNDSNIE